MADNPSSSTPNPSGDDKAAANKSSSKQDAKPKEEIKPRRRQARKVFGFTETKFRELAGYFILIPWLWYDLLDSHGEVVKLCFLAVSLTVAQGLACSFLKSWRKAITVWVILEVLVAFFVWGNSRPGPKKDLTAFLQFDGLPPVALTNECLFNAEFVNESQKTNGLKLFSGVPRGCIVVPVFPGETNIEFRFIVENDSPIEAPDLVVVVGLPIDSKIEIDPTKWESIEGVHWIFPGWKVEITNLQFFAYESHRTLDFSDTGGSPPITNFSIPAFNNPTNKASVFELLIRSSGYEKWMSANVLFWRVSTNEAFKPFMAKMVKNMNGIWHVSISTNEFEESQE